jgi:glycolate oxidase FAD binding subunit
MAERAVAAQPPAAVPTERYRVHDVVPDAAHAPASAEEAGRLLRACTADRLAVECAGGGTWLSWGRPPAAVERVITTARLDGIVEYNPADLTIGVGAGATLADVRAAVTAANQVLPLDPPALPGATVGATAALASAGPLRMAWGTPRDQVLGVEIVSGDGRLLRFGGRVVKNVAGYDIVRLFVGSRGALGLITRLHLRLRPAPPRDVTVAAFGARPASLLALARDTALPLLPAALELLAPATARALALAEPAWCLLARFRGNVSGIDAAVGRWLAAARTHRAMVLSPADALAMWDALSRSEADAPVCFRLAGQPAALADTVAFGAAAAAGGLDARPAKDLRAFPDDWHGAAHVGDGIVRVWHDASPDEERAMRLADDVLGVRVALESRGGSLTIERAPPDVLRRAMPVGDAGAAARIARGLKEVFDPAGILSPGRYVR